MGLQRSQERVEEQIVEFDVLSLNEIMDVSVLQYQRETIEVAAVISKERISATALEKINVVTLQVVEISQVAHLDGGSGIPCAADQRGNWGDPVFSARAHFSVHF